MNEVGEKYLPIGTVVMLEGATKRLMITGFCAIADDNKDEIYDYIGVLYPEGTLSSDETALFNHDQIASVYHIGLIDEEEKMFINQLKVALANANNLNDDTRKSEDDRRYLIENGGKEQVPCLFIDGKPLYESLDIIDWLKAHPQE